MRVLISGCSGGGKSTLLGALADRGFETVPEPGRRIVTQELESGGHALPWLDLEAFATRAMALARSDLSRAKAYEGPVFFDRGVVDAAVALQVATGTPVRETLGPKKTYERLVFLAPPWPEIFEQDQERRHDFASAVQEYTRLDDAFRELTYDVVTLPKASVAQRAEFVLDQLNL